MSVEIERREDQEIYDWITYAKTVKCKVLGLAVLFTYYLQITCVIINSDVIFFRK